jgi:amino acid transporter
MCVYVCVYVYICIYLCIYMTPNPDPEPEARTRKPEPRSPIVYFIVCASVVIALVVGLPLPTKKV